MPCASLEVATGFLAENDENEVGLVGAGIIGVGGVMNVDGVPVAGGVVSIGSGRPFGNAVSTETCSLVDVICGDNGPGGGSVVGDIEASAMSEGADDVFSPCEGCLGVEVWLFKELLTVSVAIRGEERVR